MAEHDISARSLSAKLMLSSATVGHWLNGTREPAVSDFLRMCEGAGADPAFVLVGRWHVPAEARAAARTLAASLDSDPTENENYSAVSRSLKKKPIR